MRLNEVRYDTGTPITGYGPGFFRVGTGVIYGGVLVQPGGAGEWAGLDEVGPLLTLAGAVDVLFLGMGAEIAHPPAALRDKLEQAGLGLEVMSSPAAARTYNVLLGEGRRIAAALLPVL